MSKITIITGSPRHKGNTNIMAEAFIEAAENAGATVTRFDACKINMVGCRACNACYKNGHACTFEHGFDPIAESILESDTIVFTMPVYWFTVPGQIKSIIDHLYALMVGGKSLKGKHMLVLGTMGQPTESNIFEGVTIGMKRSADFVGMTYEELYYGGMNEPGAIRNTDALEKIKALAEKYAK